MTTSIAQITSQMYDLLTDLSPEERSRVIAAVNALFGDLPISKPSVAAVTLSEGDAGNDSLGTKAKRWMKQEGVTTGALEEVFHISDEGKVELIATTIPGASKKEQTANVYLLSGVRSLLESDEPNIDNAAAVEYCKHVGCYDKNNHTVNRKTLGNKIAGGVSEGFTLPAPGLKAAAVLIKSMNQPSE